MVAGDPDEWRHVFLDEDAERLAGRVEPELTRIGAWCAVRRAVVALATRKRTGHTAVRRFFSRHMACHPVAHEVVRFIMAAACVAAWTLILSIVGTR